MYHYKAALPLFQKTVPLYPDHPYAPDSISKSGHRARLSFGLDRQNIPRALPVRAGAPACGR
jgi:hypothetical protein